MNGAHTYIFVLNRFMSKHFVAHKFRLKPTKEQAEVLESWCHINRFIWNHFLGANKYKYQDEKKFVFYYEMNASIPNLKKNLEFLKQPPSQSLQGICQRLEAAIKRIWQTEAGFPHFKSKKRGDLPSIYIPQQNNHIKWDKTHVKIPKLGKVKWKKHRPLAGKLVSTTTKYEGGHWWISVLCETSQPVKPIGTDVGAIDLGLKDWVVTSDGEVFDIHPSLIQKEEQVKKAQRKLSHKVKGSKNRTKQRKKLQRAHMKVRCARNDNAHKVSAAIAKQYSCVAVEDLNIKGMMKNRHLARRIAQVSWGQLKSYLSYKTNVRLVDRWYPSSKTCSRCGHKQNMPLQIRTFECDSCKFSIDRDWNAAINLKQITFGTKGNHACGDTTIGDVIRRTSRYVSQKQEKFKASLMSIQGFGLEAATSSGSR
jgi:putative transposase